MKSKFAAIIFLLILNGCVAVGVSSTVGVFRGVSIAIDPRTIGTQIDDQIMQKQLVSKLILKEKKYLLEIAVEVIDGRFLIGGTVSEAEEKLQITKMAWEIKGTRSVENKIVIKNKFSFKDFAKDVLISSQLKTAFIFNKKIKTSNYNIETINQKIYIFGIALDEDERREAINEAKKIVDVKDVIPSILLVSDLSRQKK